MASILLATKLGIPPESHHVVHRTRLVALLEREVPRYKLVLISAPAGYGKTTLLAQWAHSSRFPVAWLSVSEDDNDVDRFFRYLVTAWEAVWPSVRESPLGVLLSAKSPDREAVLAWFINVANDLPHHMAFVLDDIHLIEEPTIYTALTFLLDHLPPKLHFVLAGREAPALPLGRFRARQELLELGTVDLHFRADETGDYLNGLMGLDLAPDKIGPLHTQLEGWIAGIQLVALALQRRRSVTEPFVVSGKQRFIADYLSEDVLAHLPRNVQRFLLRTSILDRLSGALCDAVTGKEGGARMLERLERQNLFLVPLDDRREWYRYHRLFADFLHEELIRRHPGGVRQLHRRAALWFQEHDFPEQALRHAVDANDAEFVIGIAERHIYAKIVGGDLRVVQRWLSWLPTEWELDYPVIGIYRAGLALASGSFDDCIHRLDDIEQRLMSENHGDAQRQLAGVTALRCFIACFQNDLAQAEIYADQALRELPADDLNFRPGIYGALGDTYRRNGLWKEAQDWYLKLLGFTHAPAFRVESVHLFGALADLDLRQGRLRSAAAYWRKALAAIEEPENRGAFPLPVIGWVYVRMADLLYEWNELTEASNYLSRGLELAELGGDARTLLAGYLVAGRLKLTEDDDLAAAEFLEQARPLVEAAPFPDWTGRFERLQLELWLAQGRLRTAANWANEMPQAGALVGREESELVQLATARVLIVKGDDPSVAQALALLELLHQSAEAEGRMGIRIEALALQALANWLRGDRAIALTSLERALRLAEPEGYMRLFADLGLPMARLLQHARSREMMPDYVERLLMACGDNFKIRGQMTLPEPLTKREQEILELIAVGLTNQEIADQLVISPETVKKHTGNIYGKFGVRNRTEAVAIARELDLLG
jgi:LuxR family maltose regulon positive regulatory protein